MLNDNLELITVDEALETLIPAPVLITEQEVALGTAVALHGRPKARRRWIEATQGLFAAMHRTAEPATRDERRTPHKYPKRYGFLEDAGMARAMERL